MATHKITVYMISNDDVHVLSVADALRAAVVDEPDYAGLKVKKVGEVLESERLEVSSA